MTIRVLLADDQALLRSAFRVLVDSEPDMEVVGEAADGAQAVALARSEKADVVLMDIRMPGTDGLAATRAISADPELGGVRVVMLTTFEVDEYVVRSLRAGASGFLGKGAEPEELLNAIRIAAAGDALLSPAATKGLIATFLAQGGGADGTGPDAAAYSARLAALTVREREVLVLVVLVAPVVEVVAAAVAVEVAEVVREVVLAALLPQDIPSLEHRCRLYDHFLLIVSLAPRFMTNYRSG